MVFITATWAAAPAHFAGGGRNLQGDALTVGVVTKPLRTGPRGRRQPAWRA